MDKTLEIKNLSREEKLRIMEAIWEDLLQDEGRIKSPQWHQKALQETENRLQAGHEEELDWKYAKRELRKRFE